MQTCKLTILSQEELKKAYDSLSLKQREVIAKILLETMVETAKKKMKVFSDARIYWKGKNQAMSDILITLFNEVDMRSRRFYEKIRNIKEKIELQTEKLEEMIENDDDNEQNQAPLRSYDEDYSEYNEVSFEWR